MSPTLGENTRIRQRCRARLEVERLPDVEDVFDHHVVEEEPGILRGKGHLNLGAAHEDVGVVVYGRGFEFEDAGEGVGV